MADLKMFDPKRFDPISPGLRRLLDQQKKWERLIPVDRLAEQYAWMSKIGTLVQPAFPAAPKLTGVLADLQWSQNRLARFTVGPSAWIDVHRLVPQLGRAEEPHRMLKRLLTTPLTGALQNGSLKHLGPIISIVSAEQFMTGRVLWANDFTPYALDFLKKMHEQRSRLREREEHLDLELEQAVEVFQEEGWYITPVLYFSDTFLPAELLTAHRHDPASALRLLINAMRQTRNELQGYLRDKLGDLGLEDNRLGRRRASIEQQFDLALSGDAVDGVAGFMIAEAEGLFNEVVGRLGLENGCFYTRSARRIERRRAVLETLHQLLQESDQLFAEGFTRRHLVMFDKAREQAIPKRNEMQHGELGHRSQESALWASSFLMLTLEYLGGLRKVTSA